MDRFIRYAAYATCIIQILAAGFILTQSYSPRDALFVLLLVIPPVLALKALTSGPDREERRLIRLVAKARLRKDLEALDGNKT